MPVRKHTLAWYLKKAYSSNNIEWYNDDLTDEDILNALDSIECPITYVIEGISHHKPMLAPYHYSCNAIKLPNFMQINKLPTVDENQVCRKRNNEDIAIVLSKYANLYDGMSLLEFNVPIATASYVLSVFNKTPNATHNIQIVNGYIKLVPIVPSTNNNINLPKWIKQMVNFDGNVTRYKALIASIEGLSDTQVMYMLKTPQKGFMVNDAIVSALGEHYFNTPLNAIAKFKILSTMANDRIYVEEYKLCNSECATTFTNNLYQGLTTLPKVNIDRLKQLVKQTWNYTEKQALQLSDVFTEYELVQMVQDDVSFISLPIFKALLLNSDASIATKQYIGTFIGKAPITKNSVAQVKSLVSYSAPKQSPDICNSLAILMQQVRYTKDCALYQKLQHYACPIAYNK